MFHVKHAIRTGTSSIATDQGGGPVLYCSKPPRARSDPENRPINVISALLAFMTGVIHASLAPLLSMGDLRPNLILAAVVTATALFGLGTGAVWAFVAGVTANLLTTDPLGTLPLGLLLVAGMVAAVGRAVGRTGPVLALFGGLVGSLLLDVVGLAGVLLDGGSLPFGQLPELARLIVPTALLNGALAVVLFVATRMIVGRFGYETVA
jgi:cell shape-determining protein MreD